MPTREDLGALPSARSGRAIARVDTSAVGRGMADLGENVVRLGAKLQAKNDEAQEFETERKFQEFKWNEAQALDQAMREVEPGQAGAFAETWVRGYKERGDAFFQTVPDSLKGKVGLRLFGAEQDFYGSAATFARGEQKRSSINAIDDLVNKLATSGDIDRAKADVKGFIELNPYLDKIEKDEVWRKSREEIDDLNADARINSGKDAYEVLRDLEQSGDLSQAATTTAIEHRSDGMATVTTGSGAEFVVSGDAAERLADALSEVDPKATPTAGLKAKEEADSDGEGAKLPARPSKYPHLSPKRRAALIYKARTALSAITQQAVDDDKERLRKTGEVPVDADGKTSLDRASRILSRNQITAKRLDWDEARMEYEAISPLEHMREDEALSHLTSLIPEAEKDDQSYASAVKVEEKANKAWRDIRKLRDDDPALAVENSPEVQAAEQLIERLSAPLEEVPGTTMATPSISSRQAQKLRIEARKTAQRRIGLREWELNPITKAEGDELLNMPEPSSFATPEEYLDRLVLAVNRADEIYGPEYAQEAFDAAVSFQQRDKEEKKYSSALIASIARGEPITESQIRRQQELIDIERMGSGFEPREPDRSRPALMGMPPSTPKPYGPPTPKTVPNERQIEWLLQNPEERGGRFDKLFGAGAAAKAIERAGNKKPRQFPGGASR